MRAAVTLDGMEVVVHTDVGEFTRLARPLLDADPVRHTTALTVLHSVLHGGHAQEAMVTLHVAIGHDGTDGGVVAALLRTPGRPALVSGVPVRHAATVAGALAERGLDPVGALGPAEEAEAFAAAWGAGTGAGIAAAVRLRLFALEELTPPVGVPGWARAVDQGDDVAIDVLATWRTAFETEVEHIALGTPSPRDDVVRALAAGTGELLWEVGGMPVAQATARPVTAGMSRIGPVYTPPGHRCRGYAAAVTAAAARWALDRGARHVLLYTDLDNPLTNRLYPRLGFRPRYDAMELRFGPPADLG